MMGIGTWLVVSGPLTLRAAAAQRGFWAGILPRMLLSGESYRTQLGQGEV